MRGRPYSKLPIEELEKLFSQSKDDHRLLQLLHEELGNRNTSRAKSLRQKLAEQLVRGPAIVGASNPKRSKTAKEHRLGRFIGANNLAAVLAFCNRINSDSDNTIACDASNLRFVDPVGLCLLAATCHHLAKAGRNLGLNNVSPEIIGYLARMDLFKACGIDYHESFSRHDRRTDLVEVCVADKAADGEHLANKIVTALVGCTPDYDPNATPDEMSGFLPQDHLQKPLHYVFSELLENSLTHAKRAGYQASRAWVAAQYYKKEDRIRLAVVDNGCGFLSSLRKHPKLAKTSHEAAIRLAFEPRITCNRDLDVHPNETANQGIGLTVIREIARKSGGIIRVASGDSLLTLTSDRPGAAVDPWQGVILAAEFKREFLRQVRIHEIIQELTDTSVASGPRVRFE